ncbi:ParA family protein [Haloarcula nitratireducens]|uniref:ParA family protein n=1 Tax=Haloarcula nitratireducens TaxID=2487749 RepID=A0AAW4PK11_9EURY|nr:ParA family protein [Halomicroarcula nitratireducens]MBX0297635.1 ParA family protein [Halomicroarcula nitratireducens]
MSETPRGWGVFPSTGIPTVAFGNQKGGTGKTTATINSAAALAARGHDVLAIDLDPQADLTKGLGLGPGDENDASNPKNELPNTLTTDDGNLLDVLVDNPRTHDTALSEIVVDADEYDHLNFDIVPSHKDMGLARDWMDDASARLSLKVALDELVEEGYTYDYILIDCPPDLSVLTDAAFIAAQNVFLAAQTQATSRDALDDLWDQLESIEDNQQVEIAIVGLLANMYRDDGQSQKFLKAFDESFASMAPIFELPMRVAIQRAWDNGCDIFEWEDSNDQQVERDVFLEIAGTMKRAFDKAEVEA